MQKTNQPLNGLSYYGETLAVTPNDLIKILGEPSISRNNGESDTNFEWHMEVGDVGVAFKVYDWRKWKPLNMDEVVIWRIATEIKELSQYIFNLIMIDYVSMYLLEK